jgi:hypothetical protein
MTDQPPTTPAGWYPDPSGAPGQRYWDGTAWTDHEAPPTAAQPQPATEVLAHVAPPRNGLGLAALILGIIGAISGIIPLLFWLAGTLGVIGLILGFVGRARAKRGEATNGKTALWGIITSAIALILSIVGMVIVFDAFGEAADELAEIAEEPTAAVDSPESEPAAEPPAEEPTQPADTVAAGAVGDTITVTEDGVDTGEVLFESVTSRTTPTDADFGEPPANGTYWTVTIVATAIGDQTFDVNPFYFYLSDPAGNRWDAFDGNAIFESTDNDLQATTLNAGEMVRGTIVFDAPAEAAELVYAPGLRSLATWTLV